MLAFFFLWYADPRVLHSFPTRRSSDLYDVYIYPNDFPAFSVPPPEPAVEGDDFYRVARSLGKCDVVLYHPRSEEHTSELQSPYDLVCRLLLEKKKIAKNKIVILYMV